MSATPSRIDFRANTRRVSPEMIAAVQRATTRLVENYAAASAEIPEWESLRQRAHDIRLQGILHLDQHIAQLERAVAASGGHVHRARDAAEANAIVVEIARHALRRVQTIVKGKSMATEETALNRALEDAGMNVFETDVGEFIIQLAGELPSHILGPATHMSKEDIAALFTRKLGIDAPPDPQRLTDIVRAHLREKFLNAEMGITGANFIVAETGTVALVTNEGNGRLCTTLPDVHVVVAGIDKIIPDWDALAILLRLLARSATGQRMSCYTSLITGPRRAPGENGAREFHLVLLDNGRAHIAQDPAARETLLCIRCSACLNICPVYNHVGGHAYGWVYSGAMGAILAPQLLGTRVARDLPFASTLCGACADVCPVKIPIPQILLHLRHRVAEGDAVERASAARVTRVGARIGAFAFGAAWLYRIGARLARVAQTLFRRDGWLPALPPPFDRWTHARPLRAFAGDFREWWKKRNSELGIRDWELGIRDSEQPLSTSDFPVPTSNTDALLDEINRLHGSARRVREDEIESALRNLVEKENVKSAALWATPGIARLNLAERLRARGVEIIPHDADKHTLARADLGVTEADFALAESGTLGLFSSPEKPRVLSLLPRVHLAIVHPDALRADLAQILDEAKRENYLVFITGMNRTSDIEFSPVFGAHGPKAFHVWAIV